MTARSPLAELMEALHTQHVRPMFQAWKAALEAERTNPDTPEHAIVAAILLLKDMQQIGRDGEKGLRDRLAEIMAEDGTISFETDDHTISRKQASRLPQITDAKALAERHPDLMVAQEPTVDRAELGRRLRAGQSIHGAELSNGGAPVLTITMKKG